VGAAAAPARLAGHRAGRRAWPAVAAVALTALTAYDLTGAVTLAPIRAASGLVYLVAAGLLGHAAWDFYHHRTNRVVSRSLAEFCLVLDTLLAIAVLVVTLRG